MGERVRKAVIPAGGFGIRLLPATRATPKELLPIVGKAAIQYVVEEAVAAGITEILVVTSRGKTTISDHFDRSPELESHLARSGKDSLLARTSQRVGPVTITYMRQGAINGLGHAVSIARDFVGLQPFAVLPPDEIYPAGSGPLPSMISHASGRDAAVIALRRVPRSDANRYGCVAGTALDDRLVRVETIVEKPEPASAPSDLAVMGRYVLRPELFDVLDRTPPGKGGEVHLSDAQATMINGEVPLYGWICDDVRYDVGDPLGLLCANVAVALSRADVGPGADGIPEVGVVIMRGVPVTGAACNVFEVARPPYPGRPPAMAPLSATTASVVRASREALGRRTVWHVNSTAVGGGVAEMLTAFVRRHNDVGLRTRWLVADGPSEFFATTKRLYYKMYGSGQDRDPLTEAERHGYDEVTAEHAAQALRFVRPGDVVVLHDTQTIGLAGALRAAGVQVIWQCHVGSANGGPVAAEVTGFLGRHVDAARAYVVTHPNYVAPPMRSEKARVILPAIDQYSPKNRDLPATTIHAILGRIGLEPGPGPGADVVADELDLPPDWAAGLARVDQDEPLPPDAPVVLQISRWDVLKDMVGVLSGFARRVAPGSDAHLVLAGTDPSAIADDPGGAQVLAEVMALRDRLPTSVRRRVHLVQTVGGSTGTTAFVVNALQRRADVVTQKSIREGFGLTLTEAMWKRKAVVGTAVGAVAEQVVHRRTGILLDDPRDLDRFGDAVAELLADQGLRMSLAAEGYAHCATRFLVDQQLAGYAAIYQQLCSTAP